MTLRAILFDHDGTLVDSEPIHFEMWADVLRPFGVSLSAQQYKVHYAGVPTRANAVDIVRRFGLDVAPDTLAEAKNAATDGFLARSAFPLMSGARAAIEAFHDLGLKLAVVTGASAGGVHVTLREHRLQRYFSTVVSGDDVGASKPAPDCYLLALDRLGLPAADGLAIEDTQHGLQAASAAGVPCLALPTAMSKHHDFERAAAVLGGMPEAVSHVRKLLEAGH